MDIAVKRGFAIGFVVMAGLAAAYGCQPEIQRGLQALRGETPPTRLVIPVEPAPRPSAPLAPSSPQAAAPSSPSDAAREPSPQAAVPTPDSSASGAAPTPPSPSEPPSAVTPNAQNQAAVTPQRQVAPKTPAAPAPDASKGGAFDIVRVEPSGEMVVAGRCAANCDAELLANGKPHDTAKADAQGEWAMTPAPLAPGDYQLELRTKGPDGEVQTSEQTLTVAIPKPPSKDVVVVLNDPDAPSKILQQPEPKVAAVPAAPAAPAPAVDRPVPDQPGAAGGTPQASSGATPGPSTTAQMAAAALAIGAVEAENGRFYAQGSGPTAAQLRLYLNNAPLASATIGPDERWSLRVERGLAPGSYVVRADQFDPATNKVTARVETTFTYAPQMAAAGARTPPSVTPSAKPRVQPPSPANGAETPSAPADRRQVVASPSPKPASPPAAAMSPDTPAPNAASPSTPPAADIANPVVASIDTAQVRRGDSLWRISRTTYGRGVRYTVIYEANGSQIRNPNLIYPGQILVLPADSASAAQPARP